MKGILELRKVSQQIFYKYYVVYMELFFESGDDESFIKYYKKIKAAHDSNLALDDNLFKESQISYARANLVYANFLKSKSRLEESIEYLTLAKETFYIHSTNDSKC